MANRTKIVDEVEVIRWFEEGKTYQWMTEEYLRKYNVQVNPSMWAAWRKRKGLKRRWVRNDELIPWAVNEEHRWSYPVQMLRLEGRLRAGEPLNESHQQRLESWKKQLSDANAVVHYDPDTEDGFFFIPREAGDEDIVRRPAHKTTTRPRSDD